MIDDSVYWQNLVIALKLSWRLDLVCLRWDVGGK